jgi:hypothetical protein
MKQTFRACWSSYVVLTACVGIIPTIATPYALHGDSGAAWTALFGFAALVLVYFWLSRFGLTITPESFTYSSLFAGTRTILYSEITSSEIYWDRYVAFPRSMLLVTAGGVRTRINFTVFSRGAALALFHLVGPNHALESTATRR